MLTLAACGGGGEPETDAVLRDATENIRSVRSGTMDMAFTMEDVGSRAKVGFEVEGTFALDPDHELPVADLSYTQIAGDRKETFGFMSNGTDAVAVVSGSAVELAPDQLASFAGMGDGSTATGPLPGLRLGTWLDEPRLTERDDAYLIEGEPRAPEVLEGIVELLTAYGSSQAVNVVTRFSEADREALVRAVEESSVRIEVDATARVLRNLSVDLTLSDADGTVAGLADVRLTFDFALEDVGQPVSVALPSPGEPQVG
jgi:hypothetical protein